MHARSWPIEANQGGIVLLHDTKAHRRHACATSSAAQACVWHIVYVVSRAPGGEMREEVAWHRVAPVTQAMKRGGRGSVNASLNCLHLLFRYN